MKAYDIFQEGLIAVLVLVSSLYILRQQAPGLWKTIKLCLALACLKPNRPAWLRSIARRLVPPGIAFRADTGCGNCSGCKTPQA